jgi:Mor family transcriptional regulator
MFRVGDFADSGQLKFRRQKLNKADWEITLSEYLDLYRGLQYLDKYASEKYSRVYLFVTADCHSEAGKIELQCLTNRHKKYIRFCLKEGKPVPKNVLESYPDLLKKSGRLYTQTSNKGVVTMLQKKSKSNKPKVAPKTQGRGRPVGGSRFTDEDRDKMRVEIGNGVTIKELANRYNVSVTSISYQLKKSTTA